MPDPIDAYVGAMIRKLRKERRMAQGRLARDLGITFQQIQKYETGANRLSASMLVKAAQSLGVNAADLLPINSDVLPTGRTVIIAQTRGADDLLTAYAAIESPHYRRSLIQLARVLSAKRQDKEPAE
ncbi:MAG: helix-turn-helix domain-containing protein [Caulobacteraceae bacterium]